MRNDSTELVKKLINTNTNISFTLTSDMRVCVCVCVCVRVCACVRACVINSHTDHDQVNKIRNKLSCPEEVTKNLNIDFEDKFNKIHFKEKHFFYYSL